MSKSKSKSGKLRIAPLIRVSTDKQEKKGESLNVQTSDVTAYIAHLDGINAGCYGGQEHATPGYETKEVNRLLADAAKGKFDAVMVTHPDRWSRDNAKSKAGLKILRDNRIKFFVGTQEYDLFDPV